MKILQLQDEHARDFGEYGPACEGFVDTIKKLFAKKSKQQARAELLHKDSWNAAQKLSRDLEGDLRSTYDNPDWVKKNLGEAQETIHVAGLTQANVFGKALTNPQAIAKVAGEMLATVKTIAHTEKPHTELRKRLCKQAEGIKNNGELDKFWEAHAKELNESPVDRARKAFKRPAPAFGCDDRSCTFPINFADPKDFSFTTYGRVKTTGELEAPNQHNAKAFADALRALMAVALEADKIRDENYIPYWDSVADEIEYDNLKHGDDIFRSLFSSQDDNNVSDLASFIEYELAPIMSGLYIAMFDKTLITKQPATEGLMDYFRSKVKTGPAGQPIERFDVQGAWKRCVRFLADPSQFQLTSKSFTPDDKLKLSIKGQGPRPEEIAPALAKMFKEASAVNERMAKNAKAYARLAGPLVQKFERTVVGAMDHEGNLPQEVLDEAMKPLVANAERVRDSNGFVAFMEKEASKYDGWIGGNPVHPKQVDFRGHAHLDIDYDLKPIPVAVGKARDVKQLQDILTVLFEYIDVDVSFPMLKGALNDEELGEVDAWFEWDRPVRHLWDMMSEEQRNAIGMIYAHEDTSATIFSRIEDRAHDVMYSVFKYVDQSIASL